MLAVERHSFVAMGVAVELLVAVERLCPPDVFDTVEAAVRRLERIFSRFLWDSELSHLNRNGADEVGDELLEVIELAVAARERTGGRFDPTVHDAVVAAGYDRDFDDVVRSGPGPDRGPARCAGSVTIDRARRRVALEPGYRLDLGGIAKGYAVDRACDLLADAGPCLVNAGGDLSVRGMRSGEPWPVAVDGPGEPLVLALAHGAIATSGSDGRCWRRGGRELHHIVDPRTGLPSTSDLVRVTVVADTAVAAEVSAKALFLSGFHAAVREADALSLPAVLLRRDGRRVLAGGLG